MFTQLQECALGLTEEGTPGCSRRESDLGMAFLLGHQGANMKENGKTTEDTVLKNLLFILSIIFIYTIVCIFETNTHCCRKRKRYMARLFLVSSYPTAMCITFLTLV